MLHLFSVPRILNPMKQAQVHFSMTTSGVPGEVHVNESLPLEVVRDRIALFEWLWNRLYGDEPIFIVRAQDVEAPAVIQFWLEQQGRLIPPEKCQEASSLLRATLEWQEKNQSQVKIPD